MGSVFNEEPHANRILLVWPFPVSDHCSGGTGQKMSCSNLNLKWEAEYLEMLSPWSCSRTGGGWSWGWDFLIPVATVEQPLFPTLILVWAESAEVEAESWGLAVRGRKGFREPTLTLHQVVTIKGRAWPALYKFELNDSHMSPVNEVVALGQHIPWLSCASHLLSLAWLSAQLRPKPKPGL